MSQVTPEIVREALKECYDPEIPVNIVELGLIYDISVSPENEVHITMTLTTPGCGMAQQIALQAKYRAIDIEGVKDAKVTVVWEPPWNPSMMSESARQKMGMPASDEAGPPGPQPPINPAPEQNAPDSSE